MNEQSGKLVGCALMALVATTAVSLSQTAPAPIKGMASTVGLYVFPKNHQTANQQLTDESQCYSDAKTRTGFDPNATTTASKTSDQKSGGKPVAQGAAHGAAISGATGGDPAAGARRGAVIGGIRAKRQEKKQEQADQQADADKTKQQQGLTDFKRSLSACLDARGYSVD
jgi:hypothetical protein